MASPTEARPGLTIWQLSPTGQNRIEAVFAPFWVLPLAVVLLSWIVALVLPEWEIGHPLDFAWLFDGGPSSARSFLSTIATAMISVTGLVFSITMVVLQLASSQFTPRVLGGFLRNRVSQLTLGVFTASFVYSLTVMRSVREQGTEFVPHLSVTLAFALVIASVVLFIGFIRHITESIQVSEVISVIGDRSASLLDRYFPSERPDAPDVAFEGVSRTVGAAGHGVVAEIDLAWLRRIAEREGGAIEVLARHGDHRAPGQTLARLHGIGDGTAAEEVARAFHLATTRQSRVDPGCGIRELVDIACRALSPGVNDPTTAVECLDELHRVLRPAVARHNPSSVFRDDAGAVRVVWQPHTVAGLVELAFDEIVHYGADAPQVRARLRSALEDLASVAIQPQLGVIEALRRRLEHA